MDTSGSAHYEQPAKDKNQNIQVFVRVRPMNNQEKTKNPLSILDCTQTRKEVVLKNNFNQTTKTFTFDRVFAPNSKQIEVYRTVVNPLLEQVLLGYNCTVFAYGQTGTGKTFTMEGERSPDPSLSWENDPLSGIIPRALSQLFDDLRVQNVEFTVRVSFLELYNEELFDLLSSSEDSSKLKTLRIYEDSNKKGSIIIQGLEEVTVLNKQEVYTIMERGSLKRQTASTMLNAHSSRSHTIFTITVHIKETSLEGEELLKIGKLNLVDLAGSENIGRSGAENKRAREAGSINQSLLTLGRVITSLVERTPHIPYRESKLTRLLQDSLGGRTKTSIIATVSPSSLNHEETLNTLDYAHRAKNIMNRPEVNQKLTKKEMLKSYTEEVERLRRDLMATREKNGVYLDKENYDHMVNKLEAQGQDLTEKIVQVRALQENLELKEEEIAQTMNSLLEKTGELKITQEMLEESQIRCSQLEKKLFVAELERDENKHLVSSHVNTESKLSVEASTLLNVVSKANNDLEKLHYKHEYKKNILNNIYADARKFRNQFAPELEEISQFIDKFRDNQSIFCNTTSTKLEQFLDEKKSQLNDVSCEIIYFLNEMKRNFIDTKTFMKANEDKVDSWAKDLISGMNEKRDNHSNETEEFLKKFLTSECNKILESMRLLQKKFDTIGEDINQKMTEQCTIIDTYSNSSILEIQENQNSLEEYLVKQLTSIERSAKMSKEAKKDGDALASKVEELTNNAMKEFRKIVKEVSEYKAVLDTMASQQDSEFKENISHCKKFTNSLKGYFENEKASVENNQSKINNLAQKGIESTNSILQEIKDQNKMDIDGLNVLRKGVNKNARDNMNKWESACEFVSVKDAELKTTIYTFRGDADATFDDVEKFAEYKMEEINNKNHLGYNTDEALVETLKKELDDNIDKTQEFANEQRNNISYKTGKFCEFAESLYSEKIDSFGATPKRQDLSFPTQLTATSPHERILDRYRRERNMKNQLFPLEFDEEKENNENVHVPEKEQSLKQERERSSRV